MTMLSNWRQVRGFGKKAAGRLARRVLPRATVRLNHIEPGLALAVNLRRHVMFWSSGLDRFEPYSVRVLPAAMRPGDTVMDIGANIGFYTTLFSRWVGMDGQVLSIEPEQENLALLRRNVEANDCRNVAICDCAAGARPGIEPFSIDAATGATGHLGGAPTVGELSVGTGAVRVISMRVETIDGLAQRYGVVPRVIKLDIEGQEIRALEGAARTLSSSRPIIVAELTGEEAGNAISLLWRHDYRLWDLESGEAIQNDFQPFMAVAIPAEESEVERGITIRAALAGVAR